MAGNTAASASVDPTIFSSLQTKIDEETGIRDEMKAIIETLTKQGRVTQSILSRAHNTATNELETSVLQPCQESLGTQAATVKSLAGASSKYPFYKWNNMWQRDIQGVISSIQLWEWLRSGNLVTLEEVGQRLDGKMPFIRG